MHELLRVIPEAVIPTAVRVMHSSTSGVHSENAVSIRRHKICSESENMDQLKCTAMYCHAIHVIGKEPSMLLINIGIGMALKEKDSRDPRVQAELYLEKHKIPQLLEVGAVDENCDCIGIRLFMCSLEIFCTCNMRALSRCSQLPPSCYSSNPLNPKISSSSIWKKSKYWGLLLYTHRWVPNYCHPTA